MKPLFFFGSLRDRALLEVVLDRPVAEGDIVPAICRDHAALCLLNEPYPFLAERPGQTAHGVVVKDLGSDDLARLEYFEEAEYGLAPIEIETADGVRAAEYFHATGKARPDDRIWDFDVWLRDSRDVAIEEASELMAHFGIVPVEEVDTIWGGIKIRARMRVRAKAQSSVTGSLRRPREVSETEQISLGRPYTKYLAIEQHRLRHRRFDGAWSNPIDRTVVTSGDAVTVLPYDPVHDVVLLIEQFRAPVHARGDACPWVIETIAGRIDQELSAEACARREAKEEADLILGRIETVAEYYATPGFAAEHLTSFVAEADLTGSGGVFGLARENEDIRAFATPLDTALEAVSSGEINTAPAILSLLWLARNRDCLRLEW